jgi:hypothetical protein
MTLRDLYSPDAILDPFSPAEPAAIRVPLPRREGYPTVAGDRQDQVDRPAKVQNGLMISADQAASKA